MSKDKDNKANLIKFLNAYFRKGAEQEVKVKEVKIKLKLN